jgi:hypothetical protein
MNEKKLLQQLTKLGIKNFETIEDVERMQKDLLRRLKQSSVDPDRYAGLANCRIDYCGRVNCLEACWFGTCRRRLNEIPIVYDLLQNSHKPLHEVRLVRSTWVGPSRELPHAPIAAAKAANSRSLDKLFIPMLVAVGTFKVSVDQLYDKYLWIYEIHEIVAGAARDNLEKVLSSCRLGPAFFSNKLWVGEVTDLGQTISKVFRRDLEVWQNPEWDEPKAERLTKAQRREFYRWLFDLSPGARLVRYGCDQHFNKLEKKPRTFHATVRKPRPYPYHLKKYMFGAREGFDDKYDPDELPGEAFKTPMVRRREREFPYLTARNKKRFFDFRARARRGALKNESERKSR